MIAADLWIDDKARVKHRDHYGRENIWTRQEAEELFTALGALLDKTAPMPARYAVQIAGMDSTALLLCNDASVWEMSSSTGAWQRMPNPPQPVKAVVPDVVAVVPLPMSSDVGPIISAARVEQASVCAIIPRPGKPEVPA